MPTRGDLRQQSPPLRRILMTADAVGGVWSYALDLAAALVSRGVSVTLAVMGPPPDERQRAAARRRGIHVVDGPFTLEWMEGADADFERSSVWLLDVARQYDADLVHLNGCWHAALPWDVPALVVVHSCVRTWWRGVHGEEAPGAWDRYTERVAGGLNAAALVVVPTQSLLSDLQREYGVVPPCRVIPNGSEAVGIERGAVAKEPFVFSAGRLWDDAKNIAAVCAVASTLPWPLYVAGEAAGPTGAAFTPPPGVMHLGRLAPSAMADWYVRASIYALPARYEPFGLSVLEAAASGCALVLGDVGTLRENWSGAAVFVPPDNRRALAAAIEQLCVDEDSRSALACAARARASQFTVARMADRYLAAYTELVSLAGAA